MSAKQILGRREFGVGSSILILTGLATTPTLHAADGEEEVLGPEVACPVTPTTSAFRTSNTDVQFLLNQFWTVYGSGETEIGQPTDPWGNNSAWAEWDSMQWSWTDAGSYRAQMKDFLVQRILVNGHNANGVMPRGYVWSWIDREDWPNGNFHFDQLPRYITAAANFALWTRDENFLNTMLPRVESVLDDYIIPEMDLNSGLGIVPHPNNHGAAGSADSTYFDQLRSGHVDGWVNASLYTALEAAVALEILAGRPGKAAKYEDYLNTFREAFTEALWNPATGRWSGWRDASGSLHDAGYLHVNLEALARGLGDEHQAIDVFHTVDGPAAPIEFGPHLGSTDVYHNVVAPRTTTLPVPAEDWEGWSDPPEGRKPYGDVVQSGGTVMWLNYYDVKSRLKYQDADSAYEKFEAMLRRYASDSRCLTFGPRLWNDFEESLVQLGTNNPFPESGISALSWIDGFIGLNVDVEGLSVSPNLPTSIIEAGIGDVNFGGTSFSIDVARGEILANVEVMHEIAPSGNETIVLPGSASAHQVQVRVNTSVSNTAVLTLEPLGAKGAHAVTVRAEVSGTAWVTIAIPKQTVAEFRLKVENVAGSEPLAVTSARTVSLGLGAADVRGQAHNLQVKSSVSRLVLSVPERLRAQQITVSVAKRVGSERTARSNQIFWLDEADRVIVDLPDQSPGRYAVLLLDEAGHEHRPEVISAQKTVYQVRSADLKFDQSVEAGGTVRIRTT